MIDQDKSTFFSQGVVDKQELLARKQFASLTYLGVGMGRGGQKHVLYSYFVEKTSYQRQLHYI